MVGKTNFITNGSFEVQAGLDAVVWIEQSPSFDQALVGALELRQTTSPDGWVRSQGVVYLETYRPPHVPESWDGKVWAVAESGGWLSQDVSGLTAGLAYDLTFTAFDARGIPAPSSLQVWWNGVRVADYPDLDGDEGAISHVLIAARDGANHLEFRTTGTLVLDDVRLSAAGTTELADFSTSSQTVAANLSDTPFVLSDGVRVPGLHAYLGSAPIQLNGIHAFVGGTGDDLAIGGNLGEVLEGRGGGDVLMGMAGPDTLVGGAGRNQLRGGEGDDMLWGGDEFDDTHGNVGNDTVHGGGFDDWVVGGQGNDMLFGDEGGDLCYGQLGSDTIDGGAGDDAVVGGQANDILNGGAGNDFITGDRGDDTLTGGLGADTFHTNNVTGIDRITDFSAAQGDKVLVDVGSAYTLSQSGADTLIDMGGGAQVTLVGVLLSSLPAGWIVGG